MGVHGSRSRSRSRSRSPKRQRRDRSASPRRSRSPGRRRSSRSHSRSRSPHGFGRGGTSPSRGAAGPFGRLPGGIGTGGRPSAAALAAMGPGGGGITPPPWVTNARLAPQVKSVLEALYTRGKLGPGDLEYACVEFLELLGPVAGMTVLEEFASLDFFRIRNLTAFFIGICKRVQNRAPPPPGRPVRGPDGGSPPPAGSMMRGRTLHRGPGGGGSGGQAAPSCSGGAGGTGLGASALQHGHSRPSRSPGGPGTRRASPPLHFNMEDGSRSRSPPIQRRWVSKSPPPRRFNSKSPPLQRRWVSRSPAARRAGSKSPPPRRWVSKSPPPRRWVSRSPPSRRFTSKSPPSRRWVSKSPPKRTGSKSPPTHSGQHRRSRHSRSPPPPPKPQRSPSPPGRDGSVSNHDASGTHTTAAMQSLPPPPSLGQQQPRATHSNASTGSRTSAPGAGPVNVTSVAPAVSASGCASASAATRPTVCEASHGHDTAAAPEAHARGEGGAGHAPGGSSTGIAAGVAVEGGQAAGSFRQPIVPVAAATAKAVLLHGEEASKDGGLHEPKGSAHEAGGGVVCSAAVPPLLSLPLDGAAGVAEPASGIHFSQPARAAAQEQEAGGFAVATTAAAAMVQAPTLQGEQQEPHQQHYAHIAEHHENGTAWPAAHTLSPAAARGRASSGPAEGLQQGTHDVGDGVLTVDLDALFNNGALLDHRLAASAAAALQVASSTNIHGAAVAAAAAAGDMLAAVLAASTNGLVGMALAAPLGGWTASEAAIWDAQRTPVSGSDRENSLGGMAGAPGISNYAKVPPPLLAGTSVVLDISGQHTSAQGTQACPAGGLLGGVLSEALSSFGAGGAGACPHGGGGALRQAVTEHVKEVLKPAWRANKLTRETFKAVAKKAVDGVLATLPNNGIGSVYDTPVAVASFFSEARREVIGRLVEGVLANLAAGELQE